LEPKSRKFRSFQKKILVQVNKLIKFMTSESILVVADSESAYEQFLNELGVDSERCLQLKTKYYSACVAVTRDTSRGPFGAVVVIDSPELLSKFNDDLMEDDSVKIFLCDSDEYFDVCLDRGFELVERNCGEGGIARVKVALECRMWTDSAPVSDENILVHFDELIQRVHSVRDSCMSDAERRNRAAALATELAALLHEESD
jgi:hypothetical protein